MSNFLLSNFVSTLEVARRKKHQQVDVVNSNLILRIVKFLYEHGIFVSFCLKNDNKIRITLKYCGNDFSFPCISLVSTPGRRVRWTCGKMSRIYNKSNLSSFYLISTPAGLRTSTDCLFNSFHSGGEVLLKIKL